MKHVNLSLFNCLILTLVILQQEFEKCLFSKIAFSLGSFVGLLLDPGCAAEKYAFYNKIARRLVLFLITLSYLAVNLGSLDAHFVTHGQCAFLFEAEGIHRAHVLQRIEFSKSKFTTLKLA